MTFETFDQSEEEAWPVWQKNIDKEKDKEKEKYNDKDKYIKFWYTKSAL